MAEKKQKIQSTQKYLSVLAIRDGIVIMKDGGLRMILSVSSVNFALKSEEEQGALISQYQGFLNSLKFQIQIVMQSRRIDLFNYLRYLRENLQKQTNDMIRLQMEDYITYIERLITKANIMDKRFYVVIPMFPSGIQKPTIIDKVLGAAKSKEVHFTREQFEKYEKELDEKADVIIESLGSLGLRVTTLNTQEIVEMLYSIYNPEEAMNERMTEFGDLESPIISTNIPLGSKGLEGAEQAATEAKGMTTGDEVFAGQAGLTEQPNTPASGATNTPEQAPNMTEIKTGEDLKQTIDNLPKEKTQPGSEVSVNGQSFVATPQVLQGETVVGEAVPNQGAVEPIIEGTAPSENSQVQGVTDESPVESNSAESK